MLTPRNCETYVPESQRMSIFRFLLHLASRRGVLDVFVEPTDHLVQSVLDRFAGRVTMSLVWQCDQPDGGAISSEGLVHPLGLNRKRAAVVIRLAMHQQNRILNVARIVER